MRGLLTAEEMSRSRALGLLLAAAVLWSLGGIVIKLVPWPPVAIAGGRSAIAALLFYAVRGKRKTIWSRPLIGGAVAYTATMITFVAATKMTTAANAILLQYTAPIYVAVLGAWFLKEKTGKADWAVVLTVIAGMSLFFLDDLSTGNMLGNFFAILSGISYATLVIFLRLQKDASPIDAVFYGNVLTFIVGLPFMFGASPGMAGLAGLVFLGFLQIGLGYLLYVAAIRHVSALEGVLVPVIEPILNPVWVLLVIGEAPGLYAILGGFVVIVSITWRCLTSVKKETAACSRIKKAS
jgi:drug/metabolite transporter (DMT)-like permease